MNNTRYHRFRLERDAPTQDLLSLASLSESVTSTRAVFRRLKRALFGGAFLFPTESRSPCCNTRSIPIAGGLHEKKQQFLHPIANVVLVSKHTVASPT